MRLVAWRMTRAALLRLAVCVAAPLALASPAEAEERAASENGAVEAAGPCALEEGGPRRWRAALEGEVVLFDAPSTDATALEVLPGGAVLSNLGCVRKEGRNWRRVQPFRGGARGYVAAELLEPAQGPDGTVPTGRDDSARRARKGDFDARERILCAQEVGQALGPCTAAVARGGGGDATVVVTFPNGFARRLNFVHGAFLRADTTMSGVGTDIDWRVEGGLHVIRVDDQRFELPVALVIGE